MRALLDTNIVIHRENRIATNYSIGHLYRWLDKLKIDKVIHPYTIQELQKYQDDASQEALSVKLNSYATMRTIKEPDSDFLNRLSGFAFSENDIVDNQLLYETFSGRVDFLITEDRKMHRKAEALGIEDKVWSINRFITYATQSNPELVDYKVLSVHKEYFGNINLESSFFDGFKRDYAEFESWFNRKCDESAYICTDENSELLGFLYLKIEDESESYSDIIPPLSKAKRLKVGTFKVESTGFRLGERFIKIIFDNAKRYNVDEIYVTMFEDREELSTLCALLCRWGFYVHGYKQTANGKETVLVKKIGFYDEAKTVKENYPNISNAGQKFILPILPKYHTTLLPDSKLSNEKSENFLEKLPHRYALQKVYISFSYERNINSGDLVLFYRNGPEGTPKGYTSVITTLGVIDEILFDFKSKDDFLACCQNRTVFTNDEIEYFWAKKRHQLLVVKFIFIESLNKRLSLVICGIWGL